MCDGICKCKTAEIEDNELTKIEFAGEIWVKESEAIKTPEYMQDEIEDDLDNLKGMISNNYVPVAKILDKLTELQDKDYRKVRR